MLFACPFARPTTIPQARWLQQRSMGHYSTSNSLASTNAIDGAHVDLTRKIWQRGNMMGIARNRNLSPHAALHASQTSSDFITFFARNAALLIWIRIRGKPIGKLFCIKSNCFHLWIFGKSKAAQHSRRPCAESAQAAYGHMQSASPPAA